MAKLLYSVTMSLDGFIAGPGGDMSWLTPYVGPDPFIDDLTPRVGALLVGRRTFGGDDPYRDTEHEGEAFGGGWHGPQIVLTREPPPTTPPDVTFATDPAEAVRLARAAAGDRYVNVLGATTARLCHDLGALDEILTLVAPVLLGSGTRLFDAPATAPVPLTLRSVTPTPHATALWYTVPH